MTRSKDVLELFSNMLVVVIIFSIGEKQSFGLERLQQCGVNTM